MFVYLNKTVPQINDRTDDSDAQTLDRFDHNPLAANYRHQFLNALPILPKDQILDAGCGIGSDTRLIHTNATRRVIGLDVNRYLIRRARTPSGPAYTVGNLLQLPFLSNRFNGICCNRVLIHLARPHEAVRELVRVLKPGGWLALCEPDWSAARLFPDSPVTRTLIEVHTRTYQNGDVGRHLPDLAQQARCRVVHSITHNETVRRLRAIWNITNLERTVNRAIQLGHLTSEHAIHWKKDLHASAGRGTFCLNMSVGICIARKM